MSILIQPDAGNPPLELSLRKFRENSSDSVVYIGDSHSVQMPNQLTVTSELPVARKNNAGTVKTSLNARVTVNIGTPMEPKYVPVIAKLQTSIPVGTPEAVRRAANEMIVSMLQQTPEEFNKLFYTGILPE